ncbi:GNAT family N-acetyltransferase [Paenibacillus sp. KN14-4R]|uniref:GNAT family N-acetyltransferase n=1 Tax=Paenibacillus sp. KN14-4R TaxID=3445773 RepID=UPI003F9F5EEF
MINNLTISKLTSADIRGANQVFEMAIQDAFDKEGFGHQVDDIQQEIEQKKNLLKESLDNKESGIFFMIAKQNETVIGTISMKPCGEDIKVCTDNQLAEVGELSSLYVLPSYQSQGVGSALIKAMVTHLNSQGIDQFCLDSGYKRAQKRWIRKFGTPYKVVENYWGPDSVQMVWYCKVVDFLEEGLEDDQ